MTEQTETEPGLANATRGEVTVILEDVEYVLRPSYEAIDAFERATGKGLMALYGEAASGTMPLRDVATIVTHCLRAQGKATEDPALRNVNPDRIGRLIAEARGGVIFVLLRLQRLLLNAASGGYTATGEVKPTTGASATPDVG